MGINSLGFMAFVALVCLAYFIVPKKIKWVVLLISSYVFYYISSTKLIVFMLITTLSIYLTAIIIKKIDEKAKTKCINLEKDDKRIIKSRAKRNKKIIILLAVLLNFGILIFLKYSSFIGGNINSILNIFNISIQIPLKKYVLPLGISFYTLQAVSYIVDVYRGKYKASNNLGKVALFVSFFPQIVEGPIGRFDKIANQLYEPHKFNYIRAKFGLQLILWGFFKKMVIADRAALFVNKVFLNYSQYSGIVIIFAIILYTIQIYAEFSGCIDIVRGISQIFGINLDQNFRQPFFSKSVQEFWRRWNITLGEWIKEYIFYPVSFSKMSSKISELSKKVFKGYIGKLIPAAFALLFVWLFNGFWHGASWKYIVYGHYYYIIMMLGMLIEPISKKIIEKLKINIKSFSYKLCQIIRTIVIVLGGMLIFRASSLKNAVEMFFSIFTLKNMDMLFNSKIFTIGMRKADFIVLFLSVLVMIIIDILHEKKHSIREEISKKNIVCRWLIYYMLIIAIIIFGIYGDGYNPSNFIYGQF